MKGQLFLQVNTVFEMVNHVMTLLLWESHLRIFQFLLNMKLAILSNILAQNFCQHISQLYFSPVTCNHQRN